MNCRLKSSRPKKTAVQLVREMSLNKGVTFNNITRTQAVKFLQSRNNYFRIISYKKNYKKINGTYQKLDFSYLVELSKIDMYLRNLIIKACIDIEHCLKVKILHDIEYNNLENGYDIVESFLSIPKKKYVIDEIRRASSSHYNGELIDHYFNYEITNGKLQLDCPVWAFLEMISFGTLIDFYNFYYNKYNGFPIKANILNSVRSLRNACAHNNCIIHDLSPSQSTKSLYEIDYFVSKCNTIGKTSRRKKLKNQFILEFTSVLYVVDQLLPKDMKSLRKKEFKEFCNKRLIREIDYFSDSLLIKSSIIFLKNLVDFF
ncbi:Abi family protein [uncultured Ruminococcus sp.]|uniref:Abi family protein n=1 Tax=uncultured Ruminococcus sp. TaxID=165186 RepID=UPI0025EA5D74|nr:Abi family protein [uncultured Ruminococcus sp.]